MSEINLLKNHVTQIKTTQKFLTQRTFYLTMLLFIETEKFLNQEIFIKKIVSVYKSVNSFTEFVVVEE